MDSRLYNKTGIIIRELSLLMLDKNDGDKIESISTYAHTFKVANGTVQMPLNTYDNHENDSFIGHNRVCVKGYPY